MQSRQCGKSESTERALMKAWHEGKQIFQVRYEDGEERITRWIPLATKNGTRWIPPEPQRLIATKSGSRAPHKPTTSKTR